MTPKPDVRALEIRTQWHLKRWLRGGKPESWVEDQDFKKFFLRRDLKGQYGKLRAHR